jgi:hypothetical protein
MGYCRRETFSARVRRRLASLSVIARQWINTIWTCIHGRYVIWVKGSTDVPYRVKLGGCIVAWEDTSVSLFHPPLCQHSNDCTCPSEVAVTSQVLALTSRSPIQPGTSYVLKRNMLCRKSRQLRVTTNDGYIDTFLVILLVSVLKLHSCKRDANNVHKMRAVEY